METAATAVDAEPLVFTPHVSFIRVAVRRALRAAFNSLSRMARRVKRKLACAVTEETTLEYSHEAVTAVRIEALEMPLTSVTDT